MICWPSTKRASSKNKEWFYKWWRGGSRRSGESFSLEPSSSVQRLFFFFCFFFGSSDGKVDTCCLNNNLLSCLAFPSPGLTSSRKTLSICGCAVMEDRSHLSSGVIIHLSHSPSYTHMCTHTHTGDDNINLFVHMVTVVCEVKPMCGLSFPSPPGHNCKERQRHG